VLGAVDLTDLQITDLGRGQLLPAGTFYMTVSGGLTVNTSANWLPVATLSDGNYGARIPAASLMDPSGNTMLVDFTLDFFVLAGDATRDRVVDFNDLVPLAQNYNTSGQTWATGDFTGDGSVDFNDLVVLAQNYNTSLGAAPAAVAAAAATGYGESFDVAFAKAMARAAPTLPRVTPVVTPPPKARPVPAKPSVLKPASPAPRTRATQPVVAVAVSRPITPFAAKRIKPQRDLGVLRS
jgi:hypothetical protein